MSDAYVAVVIGRYRHSQGRAQGGLGLPPLSLILYENFVACSEEINCFRILFAF